ncbi:hypothetical protein [Myxococcus virescens]|uniref:Uncharacterized protein n=1 Tax=Myxococcus virescens TaxID=83456 RepID=A0A511HPJ4_9BACT|nr:hypothetical protein [Myxococcus virescens]GEL75517.1 hypothetical protein MVI01_73010 [Myxococcus virescens]SDD65721.1 hypothetical protein SAMN04488504_102153 [Myxococcus virescens]
MTEPTVVTADTLDDLHLPHDLEREAREVLARGERVDLYEGRWGDVRVTTLVVDGVRAGQASNATAQWGDWDEVSQTVRLDSGDVVDLDGDTVSDSAVA